MSIIWLELLESISLKSIPKKVVRQKPILLSDRTHCEMGRMSWWLPVHSFLVSTIICRYHIGHVSRILRHPLSIVLSTLSAFVIRINKKGGATRAIEAVQAYTQYLIHYFHVVYGSLNEILSVIKLDNLTLSLSLYIYIYIYI